MSYTRQSADPTEMYLLFQIQKRKKYQLDSFVRNNPIYSGYP